MTDIISELRFYAAKQRWPKGLEPLAILLSGAADLISEADQREKDARSKALEEAAKVAEGLLNFADPLDKDMHGVKKRHQPWLDDVAANIRALQSEER